MNAENARLFVDVRLSPGKRSRAIYFGVFLSMGKKLDTNLGYAVTSISDIRAASIGILSEAYLRMRDG